MNANGIHSVSLAEGNPVSLVCPRDSSPKKRRRVYLQQPPLLNVRTNGWLEKPDGCMVEPS